MSDLFLSTQQQLTQALAQLTKIAGNSPVARMAADVIVQHLSANQLVLFNPNSVKTVTLNTPTEKLPLQQGRTYLSELTSSKAKNSNAELTLFDLLSSNQVNRALATLTRPQIDLLLNASRAQIQPNSSARPLLVEAKVIAVQGRLLTLSVSIDNKSQNIKAQLAEPPVSVKIGQVVQVQLIPQGKQWQAVLLMPSQVSQIQPQAKPKDNAQPQWVTKTENVNTIAIKNTSVLADLLRSDSLTIRDNASPKSLARGLSNDIVLNLPRQTVIETIAKQPQSFPKGMVEQLTLLPANTQVVSVKLNPSNQQAKSEVSASAPAPLASVKLNAEQITQIQSLLRSPRDEANLLVTQGATVSPSKPQANFNPQTPLATQNKAELFEPPNNVKLSPSSKTTEAVINELAKSNSVLTDRIAMPNETDSKTSVAERVAAIPDGQKHRLIGQIETLLRRVTAQASSPTEALVAIEKALAEVSQLKEPTSKLLLEKVIQQITSSTLMNQMSSQASTQANDQAMLKMMLSQPALNLTPISLTQPPSGQGLLSGLITLLQISLASRLNRSQPAQTERISQAISSLFESVSKPTPAQTIRTLNEFSQLEQKHQLIKQIGQFLSQHQAVKLGNAEQALQGQENFYYILPSPTGEQRKDIELLIKRDGGKQKHHPDQHIENKVWHLTMKLSVGQFGEMLTKAKLHDDKLDLDFYTSSDALRLLIINYLPLFKKRMASLGIIVEKSQCQLGKIPVRLYSRPYQIFETQA